MSRIIKHLVDQCFAHVKQAKNKRLNILYLGSTELTERMIANTKHSSFSIDEIEGAHKLDTDKFSLSFSYDIDLVIVTEPYKYLKLAYELHNNLKYKIVFLHDKSGITNKENSMLFAFELEKHKNIVTKEELKSELFLYGADVKPENSDWNQVFYEILST